MIPCGTIDLLWICHDSIVTNGLSNCDNLKGGSLRVQTLIMSRRATTLFVALGSLLGGIVSLRVWVMHIL